MALIKHRPRIKLMTASRLSPGREFDVSVEFDARRVVPVEFIDVSLEGTEERSTYRGQRHSVRIRQICRARARVARASELPAGKTRFRARFSLPRDAPPSYAGQRLRIAYLMHVRAAIPWWPDAKASFEVNVGHDPGMGAPGSKPLLFSSRPEGPLANEPHVEGSLAADVVAAGGVIGGAVALNNVAFARYAGLRLALIGVEHVRVGGYTETVEAHRYEIRLPVSEPSEGKQLEFQMRLPEHMPATYRGPNFHLAWQFECRAEIGWAQDLALRVPVTVVPWKLQELPADAYRAPPTVGSGRVQAIWREVAEAHGLAFDNRRMHGVVGTCEVSIEREHRGRRGVFLIGRLRYPSLHLELDIQPARGLRRPGHKGTQLGQARWDRDHHVRCREPAQLLAVSDHLRPGIVKFKTVRMKDRELQAEMRNAGVSGSRLASFASRLLQVARGVEEMRRHIPPPECMGAFLPSWQALAESVDGALETARMAVTGVVAGCAVRVRTEWSPSGEPLRTVLEVDAPMTIARERCGRFIGQRGAAQPDVSGLHRLDQLDDTQITTEWGEDAWLVDIAAESVAVTLEAPIEDARTLFSRLQAMVAWARQASGVAGPYR